MAGAFVWRGEFWYRAAVIGTVVGAALGVLAWVDSGFVAAGIAVLVIVGSASGIGVARRMARLWPAARELTGADRAAVVRATRRGERQRDPRLVHAANDYRAGIRAAAETPRRYRWLLAVVLVIALAAALWDARYGSVGNVVVSVGYLLALAVELSWWPKRRRQLLTNVDRACR